MKFKKWWCNPEWLEFEYETIHGLLKFDKEKFEVLAVFNKEPNNGCFKEFIEDVESSCKLKGLDVYFLEVDNLRFRKHLIEKRGYKLIKGTDDLVLK